MKLLKNSLLILTILLVTFSGIPPQEGVAVREMDVNYFLENYHKPKNEIWVCYFWATWCINCVRSHNVLSKLDEEFKNQHVRLISLAIDDKKNKWKNFITQHPATWEQVYAKGMQFDKKFRTNFGDINSLPQLYIIKRTGQTYRVKYLAQLRSELQQIIEND